MVVDLTNPNGIKDIDVMTSRIRQNHGDDIKIMLVGTKADQPREITFQEAAAAARSCRLPYVEA